jgi:hypothetical protein
VEQAKPTSCLQTAQSDEQWANLSGEKTKLAWPRDAGRGLVSFSGLAQTAVMLCLKKTEQYIVPVTMADSWWNISLYTFASQRNTHSFKI